jgi:hypothetical protein
MAEKVEFANLGEAQLWVMKQVPYIQKRRPRDSGIKYTFLGEAELIAKVRPELVAAGIVVRPVRVEQLLAHKYRGGREGNIWNRVRIKVTYRMTHVPSQTSEEVEALGEGCDPGDKASGKAMTTAYKYALRQWLQIETGDEPDELPSEAQQEVESVAECKAAIERQTTLSALEQLRLVYWQERPYTEAEKKELDKAYVARKRALSGQPAAPPSSRAAAQGAPGKRTAANPERN